MTSPAPPAPSAASLRGPELRRFLEAHILPYVQTPAQYTGGELNQVLKDHAAVRLKVALAFPDTYAMGMSSLGLQILYHVWNALPHVACERVFAPWPDLEALLRRHAAPLYTLESFTPVREADVVAFSLGYELGATNLLTMLDLAGIPLHAADRTERDPLVILGGHAAFNPEPLADFVDAFCLGEGEELAVELAEKLIALRSGATQQPEANSQKPAASPSTPHSALRTPHLSRDELLYRLAREVPGVYVPRFYRFACTADGRIAEVQPLRPGLPFPVVRRVVADLDAAPFPTRPIVPYVETVFERCSVEIMRGCVNGCRFCQAGMITRPRRQRSPEKVLELLAAGLEATGYDEAGLLSLSSSDYSGIADLARRVNDTFGPQGVSLSLPSLRVGTVLATLPKEMSRTRKGGLTLAPEAATERLRKIINKDVSDEDLLAGCREAFHHGYRRVKLYFMLGLPGETDDDLRAIAALAERIARARKEIAGRAAKVTVSVSSFVPKPGTPFQWAPMCSRDEWLRRQRVVREANRSRNVVLKFHNVEVSFLEGLLTRGDRRLAPVIEAAWRNGARFDGWDEQLNLDAWNAAFRECGLDAEAAARRERGLDEILPWVVVSDTVSPAFLKREYARSRTSELTPTCADPQKDPCQLCDACARSPGFKPPPPAEATGGASH